MALDKCEMWCSIALTRAVQLEGPPTTERIAAMMAEENRELHDRALDEVREAYASIPEVRAVAEAMGEVWCYKCDQPSVAEVEIRETQTWCPSCRAGACGAHVATEKRGVCVNHLWLLHQAAHIRRG